MRIILCCQDFNLKIIGVLIDDLQGLAAYRTCTAENSDVFLFNQLRNVLAS